MTKMTREFPEPFELDAPSQRWRTQMLLAILLLGTLLNYGHRFALTQNALPVKEALSVGDEGYGKLAGYFGLGFALGGLSFGILADVVSVRWLYPFVVLVWSLAGIATGWMDDLTGMAATQFVLGFFEAGHWPCALRTTQRLLKPDQRTWGNSVLQSGASLGAVLTPLLVLALYAWDPRLWRWSFLIVGGLGLPWIVAWLWTIRESDLRRPVIQTDETNRGAGQEQTLREMPFHRIFLTRRWWLLLIVVVLINTLWHYVRVWMPLMLEVDRGYSRGFVQGFTSVYYLATFFGSVVAGWLTVQLVRWQWNVLRARLSVFLLCCLLSALTVPAAFLPAGAGLLALLLLVAFGSLGLFPIYYSMNQEISARHQGKVGGSLGFSAWLILYFVHPAVGWLVDHFPTLGKLAEGLPLARLVGLSELVGPVLPADGLTRTYLLAAVGCGPLLAFLVLFLFWGQRTEKAAVE
ncbi:MAG: MFS transporter [Pirellulaceae bacterium]|nr:MFS transporter [Pirellulaceae bacterium]